MIQREKRAYLAYLVYLIRARVEGYVPIVFRSYHEMETEINQVEAHLVSLDVKLSTTKVEFQLN